MRYQGLGKMILSKQIIWFLILYLNVFLFIELAFCANENQQKILSPLDNKRIFNLSKTMTVLIANCRIWF